MFEWLTGSDWYITVANVFSFIGPMAFFFFFFEKQNKLTFTVVILFSFTFTCIFGWFPEILSYITG